MVSAGAPGLLQNVGISKVVRQLADETEVEAVFELAAGFCAGHGCRVGRLPGFAEIRTAGVAIGSLCLRLW